MTDVFKPLSRIDLANVTFDNRAPLVVVGGLNVLESAELAHHTAWTFVDVCARLGLGYVFKASFDKANRTSLSSFRGPGLDRGLQILADIKARYNVPILTDVHEPHQADVCADVVDVLQLPAFLCRQTDLVRAIAKTGAVINIKKAQFLAPFEMRFILDKCLEAGNNRLMLCERGTAFGYNNLVVDMLGFDTMKQMDVPVLFDVTHALQTPGQGGGRAGGRRQQIATLARAGVACGIAGLFLEAHPTPNLAKCDGACALPLERLEEFLRQLQALDACVKTLTPIDID